MIFYVLLKHAFCSNLTSPSLSFCIVLTPAELNPLPFLYFIFNIIAIHPFVQGMRTSFLVVGQGNPRNFQKNIDYSSCSLLPPRN